MTGGEVAALIAAVAGVVLVVALLFTLASLTRTLTVLRASVDDLRRETLPLVSHLHTTVQQANAELTRVDHLLGTAESISETLDSASRLAYLAFSNPMVKAMAFATGTARAARRLRRAENRRG